MGSRCNKNACACRRTFGLSERELSQQHVYFLLDEALLRQPGNLALETACAILPGLLLKKLLHSTNFI